MHHKTVQVPLVLLIKITIFVVQAFRILTGPIGVVACQRYTVLLLIVAITNCSQFCLVLLEPTLAQRTVGTTAVLMSMENVGGCLIHKRLFCRLYLRVNTWIYVFVLYG